MAKMDEGLIPVLEAGNDDVVVTLEPPAEKDEEHEEDSLSSISDAPSVEHFNISVSSLQWLGLSTCIYIYSLIYDTVCL